eukprot:12894751-Prorocentrum_lima.AAC.1
MEQCFRGIALPYPGRQKVEVVLKAAADAAHLSVCRQPCKAASKPAEGFLVSLLYLRVGGRVLGRAQCCSLCHHSSQ